MTHQFVPPGKQYPEPAHTAPPRRRWRRRTIGLLSVLILLVIAVVVAVAREASSRDMVGSTTVTASSSATGTSPGDAVPHDGGRPGGWRSAGETIGAWVEFSWPVVENVRRIVITRGPLDRPGATAGYLTFGDGSYHQVQLSTTSTTTVVPITPRPVERFRFTVSGVSPGARNVSFTAVTAEIEPDTSDVVHDDRPDGNQAGSAAIAQSSGAGGSDVRALQDGSGAAGAGGVGSDWAALSPTGASVELSWDRPRELSSIQLVGSARIASRLSGATLTFGDGARLPVGALLPDPDRPTLVAFMPRSVTSVRITFDAVAGSGPLALAEIRAWERGATPPRARSGAGPVSAPAPEASCAAPVSPVPSGLAVTCPASDSIVTRPVVMQVAAPGFMLVTATAWPADGSTPLPPVRTPVAPTGMTSVTVDPVGIPTGPFTVSVEAEGPGRATSSVQIQLYRPGRSDSATLSEPPASGRTLVYSEDFDRPVSLSRSGDGADYAAAKPTYIGVEDFGDAVFADPTRGQGNLGVTDGMLRIGVQPLPPSYPDPQGWGRTHLGGMLASARPGGSGFAAQYGYFEARMLVPAAPGTWPAFWLLPADNLIAPTPAVAEIDSVELYGHEPTGACHSTHDFRAGQDDGKGQCGERFATVRDAATWHTFGVSVTPTENVFYIDGRVVATAPQVTGGGAPMFFLVDLALGGGWPVELGGVGDRAALYVDYIRAFV